MGDRSDGMTLEEVLATVKRSDQQGRTPFLVREIYIGFVTHFNGRDIEATNQFALDSRLTELGAPTPRSLYLVNADDYEKGLPA